jgi:4-carboxymuconolactone decarboxylase
MNRLPLLTRSELDGLAAELFDRVMTSSRGTVLRSDGGLDGPYNAWLHAPRVGDAVLNLGRILLSESSLGPGLTELAILVVGARWRAEFEWWAHARRARKAGLPESVIEAIRDGEDPIGLDDLQTTVYEASRELVLTGSMSHQTVSKVRLAMGDHGFVELITLCGFYTLVSFSLNAVNVPVPEGVTPIWDLPDAVDGPFGSRAPEAHN